MGGIVEVQGPQMGQSIDILCSTVPLIYAMQTCGACLSTSSCLIRSRRYASFDSSSVMRRCKGAVCVLQTGACGAAWIQWGEAMGVCWEWGRPGCARDTIGLHVQKMNKGWVY